MFSDCLLGMCAEDQLQFNISLWTRSSQSLDHLDLTRMPLAEKKTEGKHVLFCSVRGFTAFTQLSFSRGCHEAAACIQRHARGFAVRLVLVPAPAAKQPSESQNRENAEQLR
jgi:hypothetical protein